MIQDTIGMLPQLMISHFNNIIVEQHFMGPYLRIVMAGNGITLLLKLLNILMNLSTTMVTDDEEEA